MSGHSKWATIKHKKGALDAKRGKVFTKLIKELTVAARMGGGDTAGNPRLRKAIADAKSQAMPNDTIHRAVKRGTGEIEGAAYEEIVYEGTGPAGTLFLAESMTDNRNRTVAEIRKVFEKHNGALGSAGAEDYQNTGDEWLLTTPAEALGVVVDALEKAGIKPKSSGLAYVPKVKKPLTGRDAQVALHLAEALDDHDDVQNVYADFDVSDEDLAKLES
jgi:transcriptional/translational regulatory protein YebC/TACO1